jgi:hypothetical protein
VNGGAIVAGRKLDAANQLQSCAPRNRDSGFVAFEGVMVGDGQRFKLGLAGGINQFIGTEGSIRVIGVGVKVDQKT